MKQKEQFNFKQMVSILIGLRQMHSGRVDVLNPDSLLRWLEDVWLDEHETVECGQEKHSVVKGSKRFKPGFHQKLSDTLSLTLNLSTGPDWLVGVSEEFLKAFRGADQKLQGRILKTIKTISKKPTALHKAKVKPLTAEMRGLWCYRVGDYRVVYRPDTKRKRVILIAFMSQ